jgi:hypothetical protein|tara:strand:+ start:9 stop:233 length:225 start_codon:yes stop_codon:yes gene_type:complete
MQEENNDIFETSDLGTAAYLLIKGCTLIIAEKDRYRYSFVFSEEKVCKQLSLEYVNSEFSRFDASLKNLRSLIK